MGKLAKCTDGIVGRHVRHVGQVLTTDIERQGAAVFIIAVLLAHRDERIGQTAADMLLREVDRLDFGNGQVGSQGLNKLIAEGVVFLEQGLEVDAADGIYPSVVTSFVTPYTISAIFVRSVVYPLKISERFSTPCVLNCCILFIMKAPSFGLLSSN